MGPKFFFVFFFTKNMIVFVPNFNIKLIFTFSGRFIILRVYLSSYEIPGSDRNKTNDGEICQLMENSLQ